MLHELTRSSKPKNARVKRALDEREPKLVENEKSAIFVRGQNTSEKVRLAMKDLVSRSLLFCHWWS
jgi:ribosome production factor 2